MVSPKGIRWCVYIYRDEQRRPYYVGMGRGYRPYTRHQTGVPLPADRQQIRVKWMPDQQSSWDLEELLIAKWGRQKDGGILMNKSLGRGTKGLTGPDSSMHGRRGPLNHMWGRRGALCAAYGKPKPDDVREKISRAKAPTRYWHHPAHGVVCCGVSEHGRRFGTNPSALSRVAKGALRSHHGWSIVNIGTEDTLLKFSVDRGVNTSRQTAVISALALP